MSKEFFEKLNRILAEQQQQKVSKGDGSVSSNSSNASSSSTLNNSSESNVSNPIPKISTSSITNKQTKEEELGSVKSKQPVNTELALEESTKQSKQNIGHNSTTIKVVPTLPNEEKVEPIIKPNNEIQNKKLVKDALSNESSKPLKKVNNVNTNADKLTFEQKIDQVLDSIKQLFVPFKTLMVQTLPFTKSFIMVLDKIGWLIGFLTKFVVLRLPLLKRILNSWVLKATVVVLILLFLSGSILSRFLNTKANMLSIENAIFKATGYKAKINGLITVSLVPNFSVSLHNVVFDVASKKQHQEIAVNSNVAVSLLESDYLTLKFAWLPMFFGHLEVESVNLNKTHIDVKMQAHEVQDNNLLQYNQLINKIDKQITQVITQGVNNKSATTLRYNNSKANNSTVNQKLTPEYFNQVVDTHKRSSKIKIDNVATDNQTSANVGLDSISNTSNEELTVNNLDDNNLETDNSMLNRLLTPMLEHIKFNFRDIDKLNIQRGSINVLDDANKTLLTFNNVAMNIKSNTSSLLLDGSYSFMNHNFTYNSQISFADSDVLFVIHSALDSNPQQSIEIKGQKNYADGSIIGSITSKQGGILLWLQQLVIDFDVKKIQKEKFQANFLLNKDSLKITDVDLQLNEVHYSGNILLALANNNKFMNVNLIADIANATDYFTQYMQGISTIKNEQGSTFLAVLNNIEQWKNKKVNFFNLDYLRLTLTIRNTKLYESKLNNFNMAFLMDLPHDKIYMDHFSVGTASTNINVLGKVDLNSKNAIFSLHTLGSLQDSAAILHIPNKMKLLLISVAQDSDAYNLSSRVDFVKNRITFTNIKGQLGKLPITDTYAIVMERADNLDISLNSQLDNIDFSYLTSIYNKQIADLSFEQKSDINVFGLSDKTSLTLNAQIKKLNYKNLKFKNVRFNVDFLKSGFLVDRMLLQGVNGGTAVAVFNSDTSVNPMIVGHIVFDNLVLNFNELQQFMFSKEKIIGNVVLNGKFKFSSNNLDNPIANTSGEITLIKKERIDLNRFANLDSLYITVSEKGNKNNKRIFVNDIYGTLKIKNNLIELYPVSFLYILNNKEYRGALSAMVDLQDATIKVNGEADDTVNIRKGLKFNINGDLLSPKISRVPTIKNANNMGKAPPKEVDVIEESKKTAVLANGVNDVNGKTYFYKHYDKHSPKYNNKLSEQFYQKDMQKIDSEKNSDLFLPEESNK
ncbi:AsmA family protein [Candidatus Hepatincola sp. Pdp]